MNRPSKNQATTDRVLRLVDGCLIDRPQDLAASRTQASVDLKTWVLSWYPDDAEPSGYSHFAWPRGEPRGFLMPNYSSSGDIIEFGMAYADADGRIEPATVRRWWGWMNYSTRGALMIHGRYESKEAALLPAGVVVDLVRMNAMNPDIAFDIHKRDPTTGFDQWSWPDSNWEIE